MKEKNKNFKRLGIFVITTMMCLSTTAVLPISSSVEFEEQNNVEMDIQDSPPYPSCDLSDRIVDMSTLDPSVEVILSGVPSSTWTYGCTATSSGMLFGYYDRTGYPNMYTGPCNGGVCPLTGLGQGAKDDPGFTGYPVAGSCYIIATEQGLDGITTRAHVDDYYVSNGSTGDPWVGNWPEHTRGLCTADYLGTSQWKWDDDGDTVIDYNADGSTTIWTMSDGTKLYNYIPPASYGMPQTACCHGCRLFAESRGYTVLSNYQQLTDNQHSSGFTFAEFKAEIDAGRPVLVHVVGHSMLGLGYDDSTPETIFIHDTWTNDLMNMPWGGTYDNRDLRAVTVIQLAPSGNNLPTIQINSPTPGATVSGTISIQGTASDSDGTVAQVLVKIDDGYWGIASGTTTWSTNRDTTALTDGPHTIYAQCSDNGGAFSTVDSVTINVNNGGNQPPTVEITSPHEGDIVSGIVTIQGTANDIDGTITLVEVHTTLTMSLIYGETSWSCSWDTTVFVDDGPHTISARSKDNDGAYSAMDYVHVFVQNAANNPPAVSITSPTNGATVSGTITIQGTASDSDGSVALVEYKIDSGSWQTASGGTPTAWSTSWDTTTVSSGQHTIYARSKDNDGVYSIVDSVTVTIDNSGANQPPNTPSSPSPTDGATGVSTSTDLGWNGGDLDSTDILIYNVYFDTNPNPTTKLLMSIQSPATQTSITYRNNNLPPLSDNTKYYWKIVANDNNGASTTGPVWSFTTQSQSNNPPDQPITPTGQTTSCKINQPYPYSTIATDPDPGDKVKYGWDWTGDGNVDEWDDNNGNYYTPGTQISTEITWTTKQTTYSLKVIAEDLNGAQSSWSNPLTVTTSKSKSINMPFLRFLESHPHMFPLLRHLLEL